MQRVLPTLCPNPPALPDSSDTVDTDVGETDESGFRAESSWYTCTRISAIRGVRQELSCVFRLAQLQLFSAEYCRSQQENRVARTII